MQKRSDVYRHRDKLAGAFLSGIRDGSQYEIGRVAVYTPPSLVVLQPRMTHTQLAGFQG